MIMLSIQSLSKSFGAHKAVDDVSFDMKAGEIVALIGPNGAGKTTTFNMISGQTAANSGRVQLEGSNILGRSPQHIARLGVGRTFQVAATFPSLTVQENVQMAFIAHHRRVYHLWSRARAQYADDARAVLEHVNMSEQVDRACSELAYGDVKRVELAMALAAEPRLLLMDEPTAGMAPSERHALMALTRDLAARRNMAVLFTEHSMDVVFAYADRIIVLARGRVVADGTPAQVRDDPDVQRVYFGSGATFKTATP